VSIPHKYVEEYPGTWKSQGLGAEPVNEACSCKRACMLAPAVGDERKEPVC
jgi:hypothetical protein